MSHHRVRRLVDRAGTTGTAALIDVGATVSLVVSSGRRLRSLRGRELAYQVVEIGLRSLPLAVAMSACAGAVLAFQFGSGLERFGAKLYIGQVTVTALLRELGPILTALVVGTRVAAGIAAELGGMAVTEQVDAVRALGADPISRLVLPRLLGALLALPIIGVLTDLVGCLGGMTVALLQYDIYPPLFLHGVYDFVTLGDFFSGVIKMVAFALIVGAVSCAAGLSASGGTEGVGRAATRAVVATALSVLVADFLLTKLLLGM